MGNVCLWWGLLDVENTYRAFVDLCVVLPKLIEAVLF